MPAIVIKIKSDIPDYSEILTKFSKIATRRIKARMKRKLASPSKHGRDYGGHTASAFGESPANFSGALSASLFIEDTKVESILFSALEEDYPRMLEEEMNRPLWQISLDEEAPLLETLLASMMDGEYGNSSI